MIEITLELVNAITVEDYKACLIGLRQALELALTLEHPVAQWTTTCTAPLGD